MYQNLVPVTPQRHGNYAVHAEQPYGFTQHLNALPLMAVEFGKAARHYSIIFTGSAEADTLMPAVLVGVKQENLYLSESGQWAVNYVPAFVRQYPFTFARDDAAKTLTLCVDEGYEGCTAGGQGERLFNDSEPTEYLQTTNWSWFICICCRWKTLILCTKSYLSKQLRPEPNRMSESANLSLALTQVSVFFVLAFM